MSNSFYQVTGKPTSFASGKSLDLRVEFSAIAAGFDLLPNPLGAGQKGFNGGIWQNPSLDGVTISSGTAVLTTLKAMGVTFNPNSSFVGGLAGALTFGQTSTDNILWGHVNGTKKLGLSITGNLIVGDGANALATNATDGFIHIPKCAGAPTGAATAYASGVAMVYDSTNNKIYVRSGGTWRATAALT